MTPAKFKESNRTLRKPDSMTNEECSSLEVFTDESICISCWHMSLIERLRALLFGKIWLGVLSGGTQPPVWLICRRSAWRKEKKA